MKLGWNNLIVCEDACYALVKKKAGHWNRECLKGRKHIHVRDCWSIDKELINAFDSDGVCEKDYKLIVDDENAKRKTFLNKVFIAMRL